MSNFNLSIYSPSGVVIKNHPCDSLVIPTSEGMINVLKGHTHIISQLSTGTLVAESASGQKTFQVSNGISKVFGDSVTIMTQS